MPHFIPRGLAALALPLAVLTACQTPAAQTPASTGAMLQAARQISVGAAPHGIYAANGLIFNSDTGAKQVSVIDAATDAVTRTVAFVDGKPGYIKAFHDGQHVLITDTVKNTLRVIATADPAATLQTIALGAGPDKITVTEDDRTVLVTLTGESKLLRFDFDADRAKPPVRQDIAVGSVAGAEFKHRAIAEYHGWAAVPNSGENDVSLINLTTGATQRVADGNNPGPVAIGVANDAATVAIVGNVASNTLSLYDLPSGAKTTLSDVGLAPADMVVDIPLGRVFVTMSGSNDVAVVDYNTRKLVGRVAAGKRPVHIYLAPALPGAGATPSHEIWVGNDDGDSVTVFDGESLRIKATVATGKGHHKMAFWGAKGYVSNLAASTVSVIERSQIQ